MIPTGPGQVKSIKQKNMDVVAKTIHKNQGRLDSGTGTLAVRSKNGMQGAACVITNITSYPEQRQAWCRAAPGPFKESNCKLDGVTDVCFCIGADARRIVLHSHALHSYASR